jgi:hypothetical protein
MIKGRIKLGIADIRDKKEHQQRLQRKIKY